MNRYFREISVTVALGVVLLAIAVFAPGFFQPQPLLSLVTREAPTLVVACGMALVIISRQIDISVGSQFSVCSICAGLLAARGWPLGLVVPAAAGIGALLGAFNGLLVAGLRLPSIVVTLATMVMLSGQEPRLTRTKARFELLLQANRDPELAEVFRHNGEMFTELHRREILSRSHSRKTPDAQMLDEQTAATMSFVSGVHMRFIAGDRFIDNAEQLDLLLMGIADGIAAAYREKTSRPRRDRAV